MKRISAALILLLIGIQASFAASMQTENNRLRVLPAPGVVAVDGRVDDWDLTGGIFICDNVETQRDSIAVWLHAMYDAKDLYILARFKDLTPLNNPGQTVADYGFAGDCLQMRFITHPGTPLEHTTHWTCWQGRDGRDVMDISIGKHFDEGHVKDASTKGARQAFLKDTDGKGYAQELAIPWALLTKDDQPLTAGDTFTLTSEPNFTVGIGGRMSIKDIFKAGVTPDRVFTFMANDRWGTAVLEPRGRVTPQPLRLADGREFPVKMDRGVPVVNWTGLIQNNEAPGFKPIKFTLPTDGYISLNIQDASGHVVRQLLNSAFFSKGTHTVKWDGLTMPNWNAPGDPVPPGRYIWRALWHTGIGLKLRGWAANSGSAPWDNGPTTNWGGDEGVPSYAASDGDMVYLGWTGAEAGKALLALDLQGAVKWKNSRQGMSAASLLAADNGSLYAVSWGPDKTNYLYRLNARTGSYITWAGTDTPDLFLHDLWPNAKGKPDSMNGLSASNGKVYMSFTGENQVMQVDGDTGKLLKILAVPAPGFMKAVSGDLIYVVSDGKSVMALNPQTGDVKTLAEGLSNASGIAVDRAGSVYVGVGDPDNQVKVYDPAGKLLRVIGRRGGRNLLGKWTPDGMRFISGMAVDSEGKLWVTESDEFPRRVSVWNSQDGTFVKEFFGPTDYGALGGAIDPQNPDIMVGSGCEWRLDPQTGKATCLAVITRDGMANSRFGTGANGRQYLAVASGWAFRKSEPVSIYERLGDADYKLRARWSYSGTGSNMVTSYWADVNGDGEQQPDEVTTAPGAIQFAGWYMAFSPDMTVYSHHAQYKVTGFTPAGAPLYDLANPVKMPGASEQGGMGAVDGMGSADGRLVIYNGAYGVDRSWFNAYNIGSGEMIWSYPNNFVGVHGSHNAVPPETGMIRGAYDIAGTAELPSPIGNIWVIPTNVGEWHILTGDGFYLTRLFQPDGLQVKFPEQPVPGADMTNAPPGMGGEDFGGSVAYAGGTKLYIQAGKTAFWNLEVTGLDTVKMMQGQAVEMTTADVKTAQSFHDRFAQAAVGKRAATIKKFTPSFTGNVDKDFAAGDIIQYKKSDDAAIRSAAAWDDQNLYVAWDVKDSTPWMNSAADPTQMYLGGDTVDFQLGTNPNAPKDRAEAGSGDLRLSIGNFQGHPTAVLYRKVSKVKKPESFSSGIVKSYTMDFVAVLPDVRITLNKRGDGYVVEAAVPLAELDFSPAAGLSFKGDFGATHGDPAGQRTRLRTYWSNQHTGLVDDAVFELQMEPRNWGDLIFGGR